MILKRSELLKIKGGAWSASMVNAIVNRFEGLFELGKSLGKNFALWLSKC